MAQNLHLKHHRKLFIDIGAKADEREKQYIYIIDKTCKITVPIIPFSEIDMSY